MKALASAALASLLLAGPALAQHGDMDAMAHHERTYSFVQTEADYGVAEGGGEEATWDADAWVGGDRNKLWLKSEGEWADGDLEQAELQVLYSRNVGTFFDAQAGLRQDFEPKGTAYLVAGLQGLAPYLLETDLAGFVSADGDLSARFEQTVDVLLTQRLILEPHLETNVQFQDVPERDLAAGFTDVEAGLQVRYEITRKFAPYVDVAYARALGDTADLRRGAGEEVGGWSARVGVRSWF